MERKLNELTPDELFSIAMLLDYYDLLNFCNSSKRINNVICKRDLIWKYRLSQDFPNHAVTRNPRKTYEELNELVIHAREIIILYNNYMINSSDENLQLLKSKIDKYFPHLSHHLKLMENQYWLFPHLIDNSDKELKIGRMFPEIGIRQFLEQHRIDWNRVMSSFILPLY